MTDSLAPGLAALAAGQHPDPFSLLGPHLTPDGHVVVRALRPDASRIDVRLLPSGELAPMSRLSTDGLFELTLTATSVPDYRFLVTLWRGRSSELGDP